MSRPPGLVTTKPHIPVDFCYENTFSVGKAVGSCAIGPGNPLPLPCVVEEREGDAQGLSSFVPVWKILRKEDIKLPTDPCLRAPCPHNVRTLKQVSVDSAQGAWQIHP